MNPFEVTKAVDFTDEEIRANFVSFKESEHFTIVDPRSPMPQFLVGGKGGGRTHLMRYFSYPLQKSRANGILSQIREDRYLGIYFRCSGLNGTRFEGKHQTPETWKAVFAYYMDVWLCEQLFLILDDIQAREQVWSAEEQEDLTLSFCRLLSSSNPDTAKLVDDARTISDVLSLLMSIRHTMDREINNAALTRSLNVEILTSPGILLFHSVKSTADILSGFIGVQFTYLVDEYENLSEDQQRYFNTLIREKELPTSFLIGGRQWGIRTHQTLSADEINKEGSEYNLKVLEETYETGTSYNKFCRQMVHSRLIQAGVEVSDNRAIDRIFGHASQDRLQSSLLLSVLGGVPSTERPHLMRLRKVVSSVTSDESLLEDICAEFVFQDHPLLEKLSILRFYQTWSRSRRLELVDAQEARAYVLPLLTGEEDKGLKNYLNLWKSDMIAQIFWENDRRLQYLGFDKFVAMSGYLPRSLLMILKHVTNWSAFLGERPFEGATAISQEAQTAGVREAARWFFSDARPLGQVGEDCDRAIRRLGSFMRSVRESDKPSEVSITSFSTDLQGVDPSVPVLVQTCVDYRLLVEIPFGRTARNNGSIHRKFQIHPMLAPLFGLSTGRRGDLSLKSTEMAAIFDTRVDDNEFSRIIQSRLDNMQAPFSIEEPQEALFDFN